MAVVISNLDSEWGLKKLFGEETEEEKKAAEELAAAAKAKASAKKKESATSKVPNEGVPYPYPCLCYPKELLKKEDEEGYLIPYEEVAVRNMFNEWATKHHKKYNGMYEWRLRYKIWCSTKKMIEQRCSSSGQTFSIHHMSWTADKTNIDLKQLHGLKPAKEPLSHVKRRILVSMGKIWMEKTGEGFEEWAERHERIYSSTEEREDRRLAYLDNMRTIHLWEKQCPGSWKYGNDLENMDRFEWEASLIPEARCSRCSSRRSSC